MKLLTLIMIVKNEAKLLPAFLRHHQPLFDQMVIVDTGSEDDSAQIVQSAGATLIEHPWQDDFALARNQALEKAQGKWLLVLDADERLALRDFGLFRQFLEKAPDAVYLQKTINYFPGSRHLEWQPVSGLYPEEEKGQTGFFEASRAGLFPRQYDLEFSGRIHESILPSAAAAGLKTHLLEIPIHHYGYVISQDKNQKRKTIYSDLVSRKLAANPEDWSSLLEMASIFLENDEPDQGRALLVKLVQGPDSSPVVNRGRFLLARIFIEEGSTDSAKQLLRQATEAEPKHLFPWLELIRLESSSGAWTVVSDLLRAAQGHFAENEPLLMRENLMHLARTGQIPEASQVAIKLAGLCPQWQEISVLAAKLAKMHPKV